MAYKVAFRPAARSDLLALYRYISGEAGRRIASDYLNRIESACMALSTFPQRGSPRSDLHPGLRIIVFEKRASIAYVLEPGLVRILRIFHRGQDFPDEWPE